MLYSGVGVAFDGVDHLLRRAAEGGGAPGSVAPGTKGGVVDPGRKSHASGSAASPRREPPQGDGFLGQGFWEQIARMPAIPKVDGAAQGGRSIAPNPHRGMRFLDGFWKKAQIGNLVVLALERWPVRSA